MAKIDIEDAQAQLCQVIERAERGEEIVLVRDGVPVAELKPVNASNSLTAPLLRDER